MTTLQSKTVESLLTVLGLSGYNGITCAVDGTVNTKLNITLAAGGWAILGDGTILDHTALALTLPLSITGQSVNNATVTVFADVDAGGNPTFAAVVGSTPPTASAIAVASYPIASNHIGSVTAAATGLAKPASFPAWT